MAPVPAGAGVPERGGIGDWIVHQIPRFLGGWGGTSRRRDIRQRLRSRAVRSILGQINRIRERRRRFIDRNQEISRNQGGASRE